MATFGYTTSGTTGGRGYDFVSPAGTSFRGIGMLVNLPRAGLVTSLTTRIEQRTGHGSDPDFRIIVTALSGKNLIVSPIGKVPASYSNVTISLSEPVFLPAGDYALTVMIQDGGFNVAYDSSSGQELYFRSPSSAGSAVTDGTSPISFGATLGQATSADTDRIYTLYGTYTEVYPEASAGFMSM